MRFPWWAPLLAAVLNAGAPTTVPPNPSLVVDLPDKAYLHMLALPLGRFDGTIQGRASFDASGTRATFIATFPGATLSGDWRTLDPRQAFVLDARRRTLTQLTIDGQARSAGWLDNQTVLVVDGDRRNRFSVAAPGPGIVPAFRLEDPRAASGASIIASGGDGRFLVLKTDDGRYWVEQVGARQLRFRGVARDGSRAIVGSFLVWVDSSAHSGSDIQRAGATDLAPPSFAGSAYGDAITPIVPLGHPVYQGTYRNGVAYFAFTYGVRRIVAETSDFTTYAFPNVPHDLSYTVGDGFGADPSGGLYFARPESSEVTFWHEGRFVHRTLNMPSQTGNEAAIDDAMSRIAPGDPLWPPLRPDEDALDTAMLQWRVYPVGDTVGDRWLASYLGRIMIGDAGGSFRFANAPLFPFAVIGRTDDGRLWGASPQARYFSGSIFADDISTLWWSRDGVAWIAAATVPGDAGAVGLDHRRVWIALTHPWLGRSSIQVMSLGAPSASITGGTYAGEQLFFASLPSGFYLVWGATPGWRQNGDEGPLCAYRLDQTALASDAGMGLNIFAQQVFAPSSDPSLPAGSFDVSAGAAFVQPSLDAINSLPRSVHATLVTNIGGLDVDPSRVTVMSFDQERAFRVKYGGRAFPIASVRVTLQGDNAVVARSFARGTLNLTGSTERWTQVDGRWQQRSSSSF